jgi:diaminopimelate dehydrogenase
MSIRIGIYGYGNLGRGVESAIAQNKDMELVAVFTRRDPSTLKLHTPGVAAVRADEVKNYIDKIDVMILCGGSATDLPAQTPDLARYFNVVDSFDTHARIPQHFENVDEAAKASGKVGMISVGWDPGMFSLNRLYASSILVEGKDYTFWGKGVSQGHSDAIRRVEGVKDGKQYTVPVDAALESVRTPKKALMRLCELIKERIGDRKSEDYLLWRVYTGPSMVEKLREIESDYGIVTNHADVIMSPVSGAHNGPWLAGYGLYFLRREDEPLE